MKNNSLSIWFGIWVFIWGACATRVWSQGPKPPAPASSTELKKKKEQFEKELDSYSRLLKSASERRDSSLATLELFTKQVQIREQLLGTLRAEVAALDQEIAAANTTILSLQSDIHRIKESYGQLMVLTYKSLYNRPQSFYVLSAENVNEAYAQTKYFQEIERLQTAQARFLQRTQDDLIKERLEIEAKRADKMASLAQEKQEAEKLIAQKNQQKSMYAKLEKKALDYKNSLQQRQKDLAEIDKQIEVAIQREIAQAEARRKEEEAKRRTKPVATGGNAPVGPPIAKPEIFLPLGKSFIESKKNLPWPVPSQTAVITKKFGRQMQENGIEINSKGVDIATLQGQSVRSIFEGDVTDVLPIPLYENMVIVSHGNVYTVYMGIEGVKVKKGQHITALQEIGTAKTHAGTGATKVHLQIYLNDVPQNPEDWLADKK